MFNRIRVQLTIRNAAVLFVILITLNVSVFLIMKKMLFAQIDLSITNFRDQVVMTVPGMAASSTTSAASILSSMKSVIYRIGQMDRPIIQLYWTQNDQTVPMLGSKEFSEENLKLLQPKRFGSSPETVKVNNQYFRVLNVDNPGISAVNGIDGTSYQITTQQLLSNVSAEIDMLHQLRNILLFGGSVGLIAAVAAGFYLANRALIPIRRALEKQQQFVSDASHELRTPLAVIQAHTELLLRHPDHTIEQDSRHISNVLQEARRMSKLVGGLLTLARTDSNQLELERKPIQFDRIVQESVNKMQMLAELKDIILHTEIDSPIPMEADEERLHQLLVTVLDNAIKYTPEGGVVRVICSKFAHSVQLEVEDTGVGISADNLPHVFDRFYRGDKARTRQEGGTGLGLAIAKWIVERHGGKIRLESKPLIGTRVYITLPI
ncbi:sensor histidine kinase [Paenibacillus mendelii]|uniref:histidine kinase n=1 Tax=Paenibacillus mendelii TaxID=206163 RepID=A0ABV6J952_9BACL|nr:HAMP domain-containing sensor histidine kinase [Paenibacillus mendelii]MCQ6559650.1 HAMP domain-containing histidine kinase [Paenibacillus mendelii]